MTKKNMLGNLLLLIASIVWGASFVAQAVGGSLGTFSFNGLRSFIGAGAIGVVVLVLRIFKKRKTENSRELFLGGLSCGAVLFAASSLQQLGLNLGVSSGKCGFITALYIIIVPIIYKAMKKKVSPIIWVSVVLGAIGLYMLCMDNSFDMANPLNSIVSSFSFGLGELAVLMAAALFAVHIIIIEHFAPKVDCIKMSGLQFLVVGVVSLPFIVIAEQPSADNIRLQLIPLLYAGVMSGGVGYTLQMVGQSMTKATVGSLIMSLESVFAVICGVVFLSEKHTVLEYIGCVLVFSAVIAAQLPQKEKEQKP